MNRDMKNELLTDLALTLIAQAVTEEEMSDTGLQAELADWQATLGDGFGRRHHKTLDSLNQS